MYEIKKQMINIGKAMLALDLQNTHSGNISALHDREMYVTKTGSMKGHLKERDIVIPGIEEPKSGLFQASSETGTHRKILKYARSAIHAHSLPTTLVSFLVEEIRPFDFLGKRYLYSVPVVEFEYPVGSLEMEEKIPEILRKKPAVVVKKHGPFVRASSLNEAFFFLCIVDYSSEILLHLKILGADLSKSSNLCYPEVSRYKNPYSFKGTEDKELISQFQRTSSDAFELKLSPFHTGSLSVRDGNQMIYCPNLSSPEYIKNDLMRIEIDEDREDFFIRLHQTVYRYSSEKSVIFTHSPYAMIQSLEMVGEGCDRIIPVDAEGGYLYPAIPVVLPDEEMRVLVEKAVKYKIVVLAGLGALAVGHTPGDTIHHSSSLRNICYLKSKLQMMNKVGIVGDVATYVDERGKNW